MFPASLCSSSSSDAFTIKKTLDNSNVPTILEYFMKIPNHNFQQWYIFAEKDVQNSTFST